MAYNYIQGTIYEDKNKDCIRTPNESSISQIVVIAEPGPYYGISDSLGNYTIAVDTGTYTIGQILPEEKRALIHQVCPPDKESYKVTFNAYNDTIRGKDFGNQITLLPYLTTSVTSDRRRRCFSSNTTVFYCNLGNAVANQVKVHVQLPEYVVLIDADMPFTVDENNQYIFNIGTITAGQCGIISIIDSVVCNNPDIRGLTQCTKVWITPANDNPPSPDWDKSDITLKASCIDNGFVKMSIHNTGIGHMADSSNFRIFLDAAFVFQHKFKLVAGDSLLLQVPANGQTVRLEADQRPGHPFKDQTMITIEACGKNSAGKVSLGYVAQLPQDDSEPEVAIECLPIIDSFDSNDKLVSPQGVTTNHYTPTNTALDYTIRFQNTGTDTAYKVVVIDTLSEHLDISTLKMGAASHAYQLAVSGKGRSVLTFTFNNINLPDSTKNQLASNGYIKFSIKPIAALAEKALIENYADIFFDFNEAVRTNTVSNSIYDMPANIPSGNTVKIEICDPSVKAFAGKDRVICRQDTAYLQAAKPSYGQGKWTLLKGQAHIKDINDPSSLVTHLSKGDNIFAWQVASSSCGNDSTTSKVTIRRLAAPTVIALDSVCGQGAIRLQASGSPAHQYRWYQADTTTVISADSIFTTSLLTSSTTYYVSIVEGGCESEKTAFEAGIKPLPVMPVITPLSIDSLQASTTASGYKWYLNGEVLEAISQQIQVGSNGDYTVQAVSNGCMSALSTPYKYEKTTTGIEEYEAQIKIYPNPATSAVFIESPSSIKAQVTILDGMGRTLKVNSISQELRSEILLTDIKAGIYILQIETEKGVIIRKLIVK